MTASAGTTTGGPASSSRAAAGPAAKPRLSVMTIMAPDIGVAEGIVAAAATRELPATLDRFPVGPGLWQVSAVAEEPVEILVRATSGEELARGANSVELELPGRAPTRIRIAVQPTSSDTAHVRELRFERLSPERW